MILNPPEIQTLLRTWQLITTQVPAALQAEYLAALFRRQLEPAFPYKNFLNLYHLYLQAIPLETAKAAWGIHHNQTTSPLKQP